jgi:hypothetical protein
MMLILLVNWYLFHWKVKQNIHFDICVVIVVAIVDVIVEIVVIYVRVLSINNNTDNNSDISNHIYSSFTSILKLY